MIKIVNISHAKVQLPMRDMKPLQVATIISDNRYNGHLVMRTASRTPFEVMDLTEAKAGLCWDSHTSLNVELVTGTITVTVELSNKEDE